MRAGRGALINGTFSRGLRKQRTGCTKEAPVWVLLVCGYLSRLRERGTDGIRLGPQDDDFETKRKIKGVE